jgi:hypothetical protein
MKISKLKNYITPLAVGLAVLCGKEGQVGYCSSHVTCIHHDDVLDEY